MTDLNTRMTLIRGKVLEALAELAAMSPRHPEVYRAERCLRYVLTELNELNGTARQHLKEEC